MSYFPNNPPQPFYPQQPQPLVDKRNSGKGFTITSFIMFICAGLLSLFGGAVFFVFGLLVASVFGGPSHNWGTFFAENLVSMFAVGVGFAVVFLIPGLIFGIIALAKGSRRKLLIVSVIGNSVLALLSVIVWSFPAFV